MDPYKILGIKDTATDEEIRMAFRKKAKAFHPDVGGDTEVFKKIKRAYDILSDPLSRLEYDEKRSKHKEESYDRESDKNANHQHRQEEQRKRQRERNIQEEAPNPMNATSEESHKRYKRRMYIITYVVLFLGVLASVTYKEESPIVTMGMVLTLFGFVGLLGASINLLVYFLHKGLTGSKRDIAFLFKWAVSFFFLGALILTVKATLF